MNQMDERAWILGLVLLPIAFALGIWLGVAQATAVAAARAHDVLVDDDACACQPQIYCTGGMQRIVVRGCTIGCQR